LNPKSKKNSADPDLENRVLKPAKLSCDAAQRVVSAELRLGQAATALRVVLLPLMSGMAQAGTRWWDGGTGDIITNGNGASAGGAGAWNTTLRNWDQGNGLSHRAWTNANNDTAVLGGTVGTVTLGTGITVGGLVFTSASYMLDGSNLTFRVSGTISDAALATISSVIAGAGSLTRTGAFSYTRRTPALTRLNYTVWTSTDLVNWTQDAGAIQTSGIAVNQVETVAVVLSHGLLTNAKLFVRLRAAP